MPRNVLQDVVPPERKSIKRIPIPNRGDEVATRVPVNAGTPVSRQRISEVEEDPHTPKSDFRDSLSSRSNRVASLPYSREDYNPDAKGVDGSSGRGSRALTWIAGIIGVIIVVIFLSWLFGGTDIIVKPRTETKSLSAQFTAVKAGSPDAIADPSGLQYDIMIVAKDGDQAAPSGSASKDGAKASGTITIYNNNPASQTLIATTRFQTSDGLVYRISKAVTIPAMKSANEPGSIDAVVYADQAGSNYNIGKTDFTIPGFSGTAKFKTVYARSKTDMTGGSSGGVTVNSSSGSSAPSLQDSLIQSLIAEATAEVPPGYAIFNQGYGLQTETTSAASSTGSTIHEHVTLSFILFKQSDISGAIAKNVNLPTDGAAVSNLASLTFAPVGSLNDAIDSSGPIQFTLSGNANIGWVLDQDKLKSELVGRPRRNLNDILARYPAIQTADVVVRPLWKLSFPTNPSDIKITIAQ